MKLDAHRPTISFVRIIARRGLLPLVMLAALATDEPAIAANTILFWDANGAASGTGGAGQWDTTSSLWRLSTDTGPLQAYPNSANNMQPEFEGTAGTVTIKAGTTIHAAQLVFLTSGYTIAGADNTAQLLMDGTPTIVTGAGDTETISAIIAGSTGLIKSADSGTLILSGADIYTGTTTINGGTIQLGAGGSLNTASSLTTANAGSTFDINGNSQTLAKVTNGAGCIITNSSASPATLTIGDGSAGAGNYTGNMNVIWNQGLSSSTISGSFTNTGNLNINVANQAANISGLVNNSGTVTLAGAASVTVSLSGGVGSNVTAITESSNGSPLNITGALTVNSGGTTLNNNNSSGTNALTVSAGVSGIGNLTLNNNSAITGGITLSTTLINNAGSITNSGAGTNSTLISAPLGANVTGIVQNAANSKLQLSGANNGFTGTVTVTTGTLQYSSNSQTALNFNNAVSVAPNAIFDINSNNAIIAGLTAGGTATNSNSASTLTLAGSGNYSFSGVITGSPAANTALTISMPGGSQTLSGANTYTGAGSTTGVATTLTAGALILDAGNGGSLASTGAMTFAGSAAFAYDNTVAAAAKSQSLGALTFGSGDGVVRLTRTAAQNVTLGYSSLAAELTLNSAFIGGTGNFVVNGAASGLVNGTNTKITITGVATDAPIRADIYFGGDNFAYYDSTGFVRGINWGSSDKNQMTTAGGATLGATSQTKYVQMTGPVTAQTNASLFSLNISGASNLGFSNNNQTLTLGNGNNNVVTGILKSGGGAASIGTLAVPGSLGLNGANDAYLVRVDSASDSLTINAKVLGAGGATSFTKSGAGALTLTNTNTWTGIAFINGGTLSFSNVQNQGTPSNLGSPGNSISVVVNGGTAVWTGGSTNNSTNVQWGVGAGGGTIDAEGTGPLNLTSAVQFFGTPNTNGGAETLTLNAGNTLANTISGGFSLNNGANGNVLSLTKTGVGRWILNTNANGYTGQTTIAGGVLEYLASGDLPGDVNATGGTSNLTFNGGVYGQGYTGTFARGVGGLPSQVQWLGSGGFAAYGNNRTINLGGANAAVTWNVGGFVPTGSSLILGATTADKTLTFANPINFNGAARTIQVIRGAAITDAILNQALSGTGASGLTVTGGGVLQLTQATGVNTYTGPTTISAGTLQLAAGSTNNIASSSQIAVAGGATLDVSGLTGGTLVLGTNQILSGSGGVTGSVSAGAGNHLIPQNAAGPSAIGTLTISGALSLASSSALDYTLGGSGAGSLTAVGGALTLPSAGTITFNILDNAGAGSGGSVGVGSYRLFTFSGSPNNFTPGNGLGSGTFRIGSAPASLNNDVYSFTANGNEIDLAITSQNNGSLLSRSPSHLVVRSMVGGSQTGSVAISETGGVAAGAYSTSTTGQATVGTGAGSVPAGAAVNVALGFSSYSLTGARSGAVTFTNTANNADPFNSSANTVSLDAGSAVVDNRAVVASTVDLGAVHVGGAASGQSTLSTTGDDDHFTRVTVSGTLFNGPSSQGSYNLNLTLGAAGAISSSVSLLTTGEGLSGESPMNVSVPYVAQVFSGNAAWNSASGGNWSANSAWTDLGSTATAGAPGLAGNLSAGDKATFGASIGTTPATIALDVAPSIAGIKFESAAGYTIAGASGNRLTLTAGADSATIELASGSHTISAPVTVTSGGAQVTGGGTLTLAGAGNQFNGNLTIGAGGDTPTLIIKPGSPSTVAPGVTVSIAAGATLELAGSNSALTDSGGAANTRAKIVNNGAFKIVPDQTGSANQQIGAISGAGTTILADAGTLGAVRVTANSVVQDTLVIGAGAVLTLAPSNEMGDPLLSVSGNSFVSASVLHPAQSLAVLRSSLATGTAAVIPAASVGPGLNTSALTAVPEPASVIPAFIGLVTGALGLRRRLQN